jgi:uroporphyrinogen-III decarboxylase
MFTDDWNALTPDQRFAARFDAWAEPAVEFASPEVRQAYLERVQLFRDVVQLRKPARVPIAPWMGLFPLRYAGFTGHDAYYDYDKLGQAWDKYHGDFRPDSLAMTIAMVPGKVFEILDYKMYDWPGHGTDVDSSYQYTEQEYMKDDEYDVLIADPSNYWQRYYVPRMFGALEPWRMLSPFTDLCEIPFTAPFFVPFALPPVKQMLQKMMDAGDAAMAWLQAIITIDARQIATLGIPGMAGSSTKAPYDILGDTMRGTRGLMLDKFRRPEKVKAAADRLVPLAVDWAVRSADMQRHPLVFIPIHKGADGFMSDADYRELYWPSFKQVLLGLIEEGLVPLVFAEGAYNERLEVIADPEIPAGRMIWMFDDTDMVRAKRIVGARQAIGGNVPGSMLTTGTPAQIDAYVKQLIGDMAGDGGFILGTGIVLDEADPACFKAMMDAGREYGSRA